MRSIRLALAATLAASGLVAAGLSTETAHAASSKDLNVYPSSKVIKGEQFYLYGQLSTSVGRKVVLQYRSGTSWKKAAEQMTMTGYYEFERTQGTASRTWRYYAPKVKIGDTTYAAVKGNPKKVTRVGQSASVLISPTTVCSLIPAIDITAIAKFSPARPGRYVTFSSADGFEADNNQDSRGTVGQTFTVDVTPGTHTIKVVAQAHDGAPAKTVSARYTAAEKYCLK